MNIHNTRVVPVNCGLCYNTRLCTSNSMIFSGCVYILMGPILYKYGWTRNLDNKLMNVYLMVCRHERRTSKLCNETILVQKVVYIQSNFAFVFLNNALPHQQVTIKGKVLKI